MNYNELIPQIPQDIQNYVDNHICNLQININHTDAINGYGTRNYISICIYEHYESCNKCNYHSLYHKELFDKCSRHTYQQGYDCVFRWCINENKSLEDKFDEFLKTNSDERKSIKRML